MRQVWITRHGGPEVLEVREAPDPHAGSGAVRIAVTAAGVNFADVAARAGLYPDAPKPPMVVGYEVSGVIDEIGAGVEGLSEGDGVMARTRSGGYSSSVVVPGERVQPVPDDLDLRTAAGVQVTYLTSYLMLNRLGSVRPGDWVLIHAAAGGVGLAALQLAKHLGALTIGTASAAKHPRLGELGLDHAIDYRSQDFETEVMRITEGRGVDVALDAVGGSSFRKSYRCLAPMGRLFCFGLSSGSARSRRAAWRTLPRALATTPVFHPLRLMNANKGVFGVNMGRLADDTMLAGALDELVAMWAKGEIEPIIDSTFPFDEAGDAHDHLQQARNVGKVLLVPEAEVGAKVAPLGDPEGGACGRRGRR